TLAAEILLHELQRNPAARILITTQGHDPLDNMLERLLAEKFRNSKATSILEKIEIVRVTSGLRLERVDYTETVQRYLPAPRADRLLQDVHAKIRELRGKGEPYGSVADALAKVLEGAEASESLRRRILEGANLVFSTANARELEREIPGSFDLVIFEEAA